MSKPCQLYRHFAADGSLLYVGVSLSAIARLQEHDGSSEWSSRIAAVSVEWHPSKGAALAAEALAIQKEQPRFNKSNGSKVIHGQFISAENGELAGAICRLRRSFKDNPDVMVVCDAAEPRAERFNRTEYQREYMRKKRAMAKKSKTNANAG